MINYVEGAKCPMLVLLLRRVGTWKSTEGRKELGGCRGKGE